MTLSPKFEHSRISRQEWQRVLIGSLILMVISCLPYFAVWWHTPAGWHFAWALVLPNNVQTYLAKIQQGAAGHWTFHVDYTPEPHGRFYIYLYYLALGHLAQLLFCPPILMFHLARFFGGLGLLLTLFRFLSHILPNPSERWLAFSLISTSSGLGWLGVIFGTMPIDLWIVDGFTPYMLYSQPHLITAMTLMLQLWQYLIWPPTQPTTLKLSLQGLFSIALFTFALALTLPFAIISLNLLALIVFIGQSLKQKQLAWPQGQVWLVILLTSLPYMTYLFELSLTNPIIMGWNSQNPNPAPTLIDFGLGYGLLGLWSILGLKVISQQPRRNRAEMFIVLAIITLIIAIYAPLTFQRRFILGYHVLLGIMATWGLKRGLARRYQPLAINLTLLLGIIATAVVWLMPLATAWPSPDTTEYAQFFYLRDEELTALAWLDEHTTEQDVILASPRLGMFIPAYTRAKTFYGHSAETLHSIERRQTAKAFFRGESPTVPPYVNFIIYGPSEQALGQPSILATMPIIFQTNSIKIYQVPK